MSTNVESVNNVPTRQDLHLDLSTANETRSYGPSSQSLPSVPTSMSPILISSDPPSPAFIPATTNKTRDELRKLLAHLLSRLKIRPVAPSVYDGIKLDSTGKESYTLGVVVDTVKDAFRFKSSRELLDVVYDRVDDEDDTVELKQEYSTDGTYNLMSQLRDVLIMSTQQGLEILGRAEADSTPSKRETTSLHRLRNSRQVGRRSRAPSFNDSSQPPDLLLESIDILASVISEDCRFGASSPRIFYPPYSLQSVSLDVAQCLINTHRHDAKILSRIGFAVIPAFSTFNSALHTRLLTFFENGIMRGVLAELRSLQGLEGASKEDAVQEDIPIIKIPMVAIQVEEAVDDPLPADKPGWLQWSTPSTPVIPSILSTVAPSQPLAVYHLSSLVPPLLAAILEVIDPFQDDVKDIPKIYRLHTLLHTIVSMKLDAYLDILEVVAYHSPQTRRRALAVLATFWPKALGHVVIGKSLPLISFPDSLPDQTPSTKLQYTKPLRDHPYAHEFVPWRFFNQDSYSTLDYGIIRNFCQACYGAIVGFGLLCPFCLTSMHLNCYDAPDGTFHGQYLSSSGSGHQQCFVSSSNTLPRRRDIEPDIVTKAQHTFRTANLFTLALCLICRMPLWGYVKQGMKCSSCMQFVHLSCMSSNSHTLPACPDFKLSASHVKIEWTTLQETFVSHYRELLIDETVLATKTYEEVSILYSVLWTQHCILENGIAYKSIVVDPVSQAKIVEDNQVEEFQLQYFVRLYETFLSSRRLGISYTLQEYYNLNKKSPFNEPFVMFDWPLLANVASVIKSPLSTQPLAVPPPLNLLHVNNLDVGNSLDTPSHPCELVPLSQMRKALGVEFQVHSEIAAQYMLSHISLIGFFDPIDSKGGIFDYPAPSQVLCSFPLPSGLDLSTSVETLVVAIEACLRDIDISVNEHGFLLLVRRFWPIGAASEYAMTRLTKIVLSWVLAEDDQLVAIARDYVARNLTLPGVRTTSDISPWPSASRQGANKGVHSGGEYVMCRKLLLVRHALPWLAAVHALDVPLYITCIWDLCEDVADMSDNGRVIGSLYSSKVDAKREIEMKIARGEAMLRSIIKLVHSNITMSTFEALLIRWFDSIVSYTTPRDPLIFKSLSRLFNHEGDASRRTSTMNDPSLGLQDPVPIDPWKTFEKVASKDLHGLERSLSWVRIMAHSAVDIPIHTFKRMFELTDKFHASFSMVVLLLESTMTSMWSKTFGSNGLDILMTDITNAWAEELLRRMRFAGETEAVCDFLRYSLITCLLVYGCERQTIISLGFISSEELANMPQRRRVARASVVSSALAIDPRLVVILSRFVNEGPDSVCVLVAKFLNTLISESALLETHEVDDFILISGDALSRCAWRFYELTSQGLSDIRTSFLVRILVVDPQPFDALLLEILQKRGEWQVRFHAINRLFRIILDVTSPAFGVEGRQWKSNVAGVLNHFFRALWADDREEIRSAVDTSAQTLLPAHLQVISSFWNENMSKSPISDRAKLSAFLVQLHPHFPAWQVLSWETIIEILLDDDFVYANGEDEGSNLSTYGYTPHLRDQARGSHDDDPYIIALRVSLILLSLQMVADGIPINIEHLLKIKLILAKFLGFKSNFLRPAVNGQAFHVQLESLDKINQLSFPCIGPLMRVLDAPHALSLSPSAMGVTWNELTLEGLVGDVFIDIVSRLWEDIGKVQALPYSVLRAFLESLLLVIVKHDLNSPVLKHLDEVVCDAVKTVTNFVASDSSYDLRHLCLSVMQAFMQEYPPLALRILRHQVIVLTDVAITLRLGAEDSLVIQTREFLEKAFVQYEVAGLFWLLSKQGRLSDDFFVLLRTVVYDANASTSIPGEALRDSIVRDTLSKVAASTTDRAVPDALYNLEKYVTICHHQYYPTSLIHHIGLRLAAVARQITDYAASTMNRPQKFDPNPLLLMSATIMQHHTAQSLDLVSHIETLLHAALSRFEVHPETLNHLLYAVSTMSRHSRQADANSTELSMNQIAMCILEVLSDSLKGKIRPVASTLTTMLEATISMHRDEKKYIPTSTVIRAGVDAILYLTYPLYRETHGQAEFAASLAAAKLFLHVSNHDASLLTQSLAGDTRNPSPVRVWNLVALTALSGAESNSSVKLLALLPSFVLAYITSLKEPLSGILNDSVAPNVNHALASVKLWMLIARKSLREQNTGGDTLGSDATERMIWNELWPSFERLLALSQADSTNGEIPTLSSFIWACISDLMLFVSQIRSVVALDTHSHVTILSKLHASSRRDSAGSKFSRTLRSISEPPADLSFDILVSQVTSDVLAAEKLQAVGGYKQGTADKRREPTERRRVDAREHRTTS